MAIQPQEARVLEFTDYLLESYIKHDADFPSEIVGRIFIINITHD